MSLHFCKEYSINLFFELIISVVICYKLLFICLVLCAKIMNSIYLICYQNILRVLVLENNGIPNPKDKGKLS